MTLEVLPLVLLAPLPFWALGLPWFIRSSPSRIRIAPLAGCALGGFYAELAMIVGLPVLPSVGILIAVSAAMAALLGQRSGKPPAVASALREWLPIYLVAVLAASLSPFPVLGSWEGDWLLSYQMGQAVIHTGLQSDMLARPPLFGAAAAPLWILADGLIPYQLMAAVASAASATAALSLVDHFWPKTPRIVLLPLLLSPFFLHHTAAAWSKLLAAGLILAAVTDGLVARRLASNILFAFAVAVHEGSILWAPCVLVANITPGVRWRAAIRAMGPMIVIGVLVVAPFQVWILHKYGLAAKVAASPVLDQGTHQPFALKTLLAVVTTVVGWGPIASVVRWLGQPHPTAASVASKEAYWLTTSWITTLSGTLTGLLFPFVLTRGALKFSPAVRSFLNPWMTAAVGSAVLLTALLTPFYGNEGMMQTALVGLGLGSYGLLAGQAAATLGVTTAPAFRRMALFMGLLGTLPWLVLNIGISTGLWLSSAFRDRMRAGSEGDYFSTVDNGLRSLGMTAFPEVPILCVTLLIGWLVLRRFAAKSPDMSRQEIA